MGPRTSNRQSFEAPVDKLVGRIKMWKGFVLSTFQKICIWNCYLAPILSYVEQVRLIPPDLNAVVLKCLGSFLGGVHGWIVPEGLGFLGHWFGLHVAPRLPLLTNLAALGRVFIVFQIREPVLVRSNASIGPIRNFCCGLDIVAKGVDWLAKAIWSDLVSPGTL